MSQRSSGYSRKYDEEYPTPPWPVAVIGNYLRSFRVESVWEPAAGHPAMALALRELGFQVRATSKDFFCWNTSPSTKITAVVTNPPYGEDRRGKVAADFIRHALSLPIQHVCMLLRVDFDSAKGRVDLFRDCPAFAGKIVLLDRIKWFDGPSSPSDNHAWFLWYAQNLGAPHVYYAERAKEDE